MRDQKDCYKMPKKNYTDPFSPNVDSTLPPRGIGLESGTAEERREGTPRTEEEREVRHQEKTKKDAFNSETFKPMSTPIKEQWKEWHKKHGR